MPTLLRTVMHSCSRHPGDKFEMGQNLVLSKALNNRYHPLLLENWGILRTFWVPTCKNTPFGFWVCKHKKPQNSEKNLFTWCLHLNVAWNSSGIKERHFWSCYSLEGIWCFLHQNCALLIKSFVPGYKCSPKKRNSFLE